MTSEEVWIRAYCAALSNHAVIGPADLADAAVQAWRSRFVGAGGGGAASGGGGAASGGVAGGSKTASLVIGPDGKWHRVYPPRES